MEQEKERKLGNAAKTSSAADRGGEYVSKRKEFEPPKVFFFFSRGPSTATFDPLRMVTENYPTIFYSET